MNGKEYLSAFSVFHEKDVAYYDALEQGQNLTPELALSYLRGDEQLDTLLGAMYFDDEAPESPSTPEEIAEMRDNVRKLRTANRIYRSVGRQAIERSGLARCNAFGLSDFTAEWMTPEEVDARVDADREILSGMGKLHATDVFGRAVLNLETKRFAGKPAEAIHDAMGHTKREFYQSLELYNRTVKVERSYYNGSRGASTKEAHPVLGFGVTVLQAGKLIKPPKWLTESSEWHSPLHKICSVLSEFDTYIALTEWVQDRKLALVPVIAPRSVEDGRHHHHRPGDKNFRADILLLDITANEIIPIQVKHRATQMERDKYFDGMSFVDPKALGLQTYGHKPVTRPSGTVATGDVVVTSHGQILSAWLNLAGSKAPKKVDKLAFQKLLEPAFRTFDAILEANKQHKTIAIPEQATVDLTAEELKVSA